MMFASQSVREEKERKSLHVFIIMYTRKNVVNIHDLYGFLSAYVGVLCI